MTDPLKARSFTIRLTPEDQTALTELCTLYGLDRPDSLRRAIRQVLAAEHKTIISTGYFRPVGAAAPEGFLVRIMPKEDHEPAE